MDGTPLFALRMARSIPIGGRLPAAGCLTSISRAGTLVMEATCESK
jgi:hypothetical protein